MKDLAMVKPLLICSFVPASETMIKKLLEIFRDFKTDLLKEENTWMWSIIAIFALIFTALLLLFNFLLFGGMPS